MSFEQIVSECEKPFDELKKIAASKQLEVSKLDFDVVTTSLYIRLTPNEPFIIADDSAVEKLKSDSAFALNENMDLKEIYTIKVYSLNAPKRVELAVILTANKTLTNISATIKKESKIQITDTLLRDIYSELNKIKLKHSLLLTPYRDELFEQAKELSESIQKEGKLGEGHRVTLCSFYEAEPTVNAHFEYTYKSKIPDKDSVQRIDHSMRDLSLGVKAGDVIFSYTKPKKGTIGRDCKGHIVIPQDPVEIDLGGFGVDNTIRVVEKGDVSEYIAEKGGSVTEEGGRYSIIDTLELSNISFKDTGAILFDLDSGMKIKVTNTDPVRDAIEENSSVTTSELEVFGNVGSAVEIRAKKVIINGQTHQNSDIQCEEAEIGVHKGQKLKCTKATIKRLEGGVVEAEDVEIEDMLGGTVYAKNVYVKILHSNANIYAVSTIDIYHVSGGENKLHIDLEAYPDQKELIEETRERKVSLENSLKKEVEELQKKSELLKHSMPAINDIKTKLTEIKSSGGTTPPVLSNKLREFLLVIKRVDELKREVEEKKSELASVKKKIAELNELIYSSKIVTTQSWNGYNEIKFKTLEPRVELMYVPKGKEKEIFLKLDEEGHNKIEVKY